MVYIVTNLLLRDNNVEMMRNENTLRGAVTSQFYQFLKGINAFPRLAMTSSAAMGNY
jgi:hypothetical protein